MNYCSNCGSKKLNTHSEYIMCQDCKTEHYQNPAPTVGALLVFENKLLLAKRSFNPGKGLWSIVGGFVERAETLEQALDREFKEELNLNIKNAEINSYLGSYSRVYEYQNKIHDTLFSVFIIYLTTEQIQKISINHENSQFHFFTLDEVQELQNKGTLYPEIFEIIQDFRSKCK
jgi:NADH pyrophosphatase NudC (nudix superfamily)